MEETVGLFDIFHTIKKRWNVIVLLTLIAVLISASVSYYILKPVYQASTQILVNQKNTENKIDYTQLQSNVDLINTYRVILKSPVILEKAIDKLNLTQSWEELNQHIQVTSQENSQVFSLMVEDQDASKAVVIANTVSETFQEEIKGIMNVDNVSIIAKAELKQNPIPVKPKPILNMAIAFVIGVMIGIGTALLLDFMDNTFKDEHDVEACLGLPVLGTVQKMPKVHEKGKRDSKTQTMGSEKVVSSVEK
ncbi:putative capsular polysaccharide biosynthesis protein YwqC [Neobacillus rhizosphaerae]|uniref:Capsular polysaccharide biosynthesis protein YwqC n=1 Tax=Neobacillus rhizosphaerae TaxID=2880965 RepID=A0ABM9ERS3_9BACI|nr:Wzz/FepE/Etk N-terminal domain-containing protein [Neobacillus rhizosphaerae]CAH2714876.1 putative capsular polysaccharide biosynthesis protein YwqC [Neobacillus rhizosphaerae]